MVSNELEVFRDRWSRTEGSARQAFSLRRRRRSTDEGMRMASRYLATVRRAMSTPASLRISTIESSEWTSRSEASASISWRILWRTASAEWAPPPSGAWMGEVKKNFISKTPREVARYLFEVTRLTVDSCMPIASATVFRFSGRRCSTPKARKESCWRTISEETLRMVLARWSRLLTSQLAWAAQS